MIEQKGKQKSRDSRFEWVASLALGVVAAVAISTLGTLPSSLQASSEETRRPLIIASDLNSGPTNLEDSEITPSIASKKEHNHNQLIAELKHDLNESEANREQLRRRLRDLEKEKNEQERRVSLMEEKLQSLSNEIERSATPSSREITSTNETADLIELSSKPQDIGSLLKEKERRIAQIEEELAQQKMQIVAKNKQLESQAHIYRDTEKQLHHQVLQMVSSLELEKSRTQELSIALAESRKKKQGGEERNYTLEKELMAATRKVAELQAKQVEAQEMLQASEQEIREAHFAAAVRTKEISDEIQSLNELIAAKERLLQDEKLSSKNIAKQLAELNLELTSAQENQNQAENKLRELSSNHELELQRGQELTALVDELTKKNEELQELHLVNRTKLEEAERLANELGVHKNQILQKQRIIGELEGRLGTLALNYELSNSLKIETDHERQKVQHLPLEIERLQEELVLKKEELKSKELSQQIFQDRILESLNALTQSYDQERAKSELLAAKVTSLEQASVQKEEELRAAAQSEIEALNERLSLSLHALDEKDKAFSEQETAIDTLQAEIAKQQKELLRQEFQMDKLRSETEFVRKSEGSLESMIAEIESEKQQLEKQVAALGEKLHEEKNVQQNLEKTLQSALAREGITSENAYRLEQNIQEYAQKLEDLQKDRSVMLAKLEEQQESVNGLIRDLETQANSLKAAELAKLDLEAKLSALQNQKEEKVADSFLGESKKPVAKRKYSKRSLRR